MHAKLVVDGLYMIPVGSVNTFLLISDEDCTLIDTGFPGSSTNIILALRELGKIPKTILLTHAHPDHIGGFAALKKITGAEAYMHRLDAPIAVAGNGFRPMKPAPGLRRRLLFSLFVKFRPVEGAFIDHALEDGQELPNGLRVIHAPGHCAGQVAFHWREHGGVLIAADACSNMMGLGWSLGYEAFEEGQRSLKKLSALDFQVACFGHGNRFSRMLIAGSGKNGDSEWQSPTDRGPRYGGYGFS